MRLEVHQLGRIRMQADIIAVVRFQLVLEEKSNHIVSAHGAELFPVVKITTQVYIIALALLLLVLVENLKRTQDGHGAVLVIRQQAVVNADEHVALADE
jgi:hypothetical protein